MRHALCSLSGWLFVLLIVVGCGKDDGIKKVIPCGNGELDSGEICDPGIDPGLEGACPTRCDETDDECTTMVLEGFPGRCNVQCVSMATECGGGANCGDGKRDADEDCDGAIPSGQPGACECDFTVTDACTRIVEDASPGSCSLTCTTTAVTECTGGDGCCAAGCTSLNDSDCEPVCGDGIIGNDELCDGNCPTACDDSEACTVDQLVGSEFQCDAQCTYDIIAACSGGDGCCPSGCDYFSDVDCPFTCDAVTTCDSGDGCCPAGCDATTDVDCSVICGDGMIGAGETCDGNCPVSCDDGVACTADFLQGSAGNCDVTCSNTTIAACTSNDGCCPVGCTAVNDNDCSASCGNGVREGVETCDGNCPATCDDQNACTTNIRSGASNQCNVSCSYPAITACVSGDSCCPAGCTFPADSDCTCVPDTCASLGWECGTLADNGCGGSEICATCGADEVCDNHVCSPTYRIGTACATDTQCAADGLCITETEFGWTDGYCTRQCTFDTDCGANGHCDPTGLCQKSCTANTDCRAPNYECYDPDTDGKSECAPVGSGTGAIGAACTAYNDCAGGQDGFCGTQAASDILGGYCSEACSIDADCPAGSHCSTNGSCYDSCATNAECRGTGFDCVDYDADARLECFRSATGAGVVGAACTEYWDCAGGVWGACATNGWPGGYCTVLCGTAEGTCPTGSACDAASGNVCLDTCQNTNQCRTSYSCVTSGSGNLACLP